MELHPFLEKNLAPNPGLWYVLSARGDCPNLRVGHTCSYVPGPDGFGGRIFVVGGANPDGSFGETYVLNLDNMSWDTVEGPGLRPRYEHSAFIPASQPNKVYIFGGADQGGNHNDVQVFDMDTTTWSTVTPKGTTSAPSARTYHTTACSGDKFIVYSGGQSGSDPVGDRQVHCFDARAHTWETLNVRGNPPKPRHGHLQLVVGNRVFFHGGMSGTTFYDDLHVLDLDKNSWTCVKQKKVFPCARAAHGGFVCDSDIYIFGGMNREGALDDLYKLDTGSLKWTKIDHDGPPPACRLDFATCVVRLRVPVSPPVTNDQVMANSCNVKEVLDQNFRMGSAGSVRSLSSVSSAGSVRSSASVGSVGSPVGSYTGSTGSASDLNLEVTGKELPSSPTTQSPPHSASATGEAAGDQGEAEAQDLGPHKFVDLALVLGGMDTEGEIFDDCLVMLLNESQPDGESADGHMEGAAGPS